MKLTPNTVVTCSFMVKKLEELRTNKGQGKPYYSGEVYDQDGCYPTKIWDPHTIGYLPASGDVIEGDWKVETYNGKTQLVLSSLTAVIAGSSVEDASSFVRSSPITETIWRVYYDAQVRPLIEDKSLEKLVDLVLTETPFFSAPAAKSMHQNWRGGLAEHTHRLLRLFVGLTSAGHSTVDGSRKGLVIAGLVLHDYCKAYEYEEVSPGQYEVGTWGNLLGHLAGGPIFLATLIAQHPELELTPNLYNHLMHVLLAHHGQLQWGSPVVPATREATIVHYLDNLDGKLSMIEEAKPGAKSFGLGCTPQTYDPEAP